MSIERASFSLLQTFTQSSDAGACEAALSTLLTEHAQPIAQKIVRYKTRGATDDAEEINSEVMLQIVGRLQSSETTAKKLKISIPTSPLRLIMPATVF